MRITVIPMSHEEAEERGIPDWPTWESGVARFGWSYDVQEECYILAGRARVETEDGNVEIEKGDYVVFPAGLECTWDVQEPVKKRYRMGSD